MNESALIVENASQVIVGKGKALELMTVALLAGGHILLEDVPGLGKTLMAKALARSIGGSFKRIQAPPTSCLPTSQDFRSTTRKAGNLSSIQDLSCPMFSWPTR